MKKINFEIFNQVNLSFEDKQRIILNEFTSITMFNSEDILDEINNSSFKDAFISILKNDEITNYHSPTKISNLINFLDIDHKEDLISLVHKSYLPFLVNNYFKFEYTAEEKDILITHYNKFSSTVDIETAKKIFNKTGLINPFLRFNFNTIYFSEQNLKLNYSFFVEYFKFVSKDQQLNLAFFVFFEDLIGNISFKSFFPFSLYSDFLDIYPYLSVQIEKYLEDKNEIKLLKMTKDIHQRCKEKSILIENIDNF